MENSKALFIWCQVPETTPLRVAVGEKFFHSFVYDILSSVYMRWVRQLVVGSCLASTGRVTSAGETTFSHVNRSDRSPGTRQQNLIVRACEARVFLLFICSLIFLRKKGKIWGSDRYYPRSL